MDLEKLKRDLGVRTIGILDEIGLVSPAGVVDGVELLSTSDAYASKNKDMLIVASANLNNKPFVLLTSGVVVAKQKKPEISQVLLDATKAEMLIKGILHAYPNLNLKQIKDKVVSSDSDADADSAEEGDSCDCCHHDAPDVAEAVCGIEGCDEPIHAGETAEDEDSDEDSDLAEALETLEVDLTGDDVDEIIGNLKDTIADLLELKKDGFNSVVHTEGTQLFITKEEDHYQLDPDEAIDIHLKNKEYGQDFRKEVPGEVETYKRRNKTFYIGTHSDSKLIKLLESNVEQVARECSQDLPATKHSKAIVIDKGLAKQLIKAFKKVYINGKPD